MGSHSLPSASAAQDVAKLAAAAAVPDRASGAASDKAAVVAVDASTDANADPEVDAEIYEHTHVHGVYEAIAPHFSATRYKPWPVVADFLQAQPPGSVGIDVGCGNGKYLGVNKDVFMVGSDRSSNLVGHARRRCRELEGKEDPAVAQAQAQTQSQGKKNKKKKGVSEAHSEAADAASDAQVAIADVLVADGLSLPFRERAVDFAICVAVVHHMSTRSRRQEAIRQLLRCVSTGVAGSGGTGHVLVYVWALEQGNSRRGWDEGGEQDLLVPWVLKSQQKKKTGPQAGTTTAAPAVSTRPVATDNKSGEPEGPTDAKQDDRTNADSDANKGAAPSGSEPHQHTDPVYQRYYHLYRKGELEEDVLAVGGSVVSSGYDRDNWWVVAANGAPPSRPT